MFKDVTKILLVCYVFLVSGCHSSDQTLSVLAASDLKDIEPMFENIAEKTGIRLEITYSPSLAGSELIANATDNFDLAWFPDSNYLKLLDKTKIIAEENIAYSPIILAVKQPVAQRWGWNNNSDKVSWKDIVNKIGAGELRFGMTDPTLSNSGFSTVMGVHAAFSETKKALSHDNIDFDLLKNFFGGHDLSSPSSGWLIQKYKHDEYRIDGLFNYESAILELNASGQLRDKLVPIYPEEGYVTSHYPVILLNKTRENSFKKLVAYLKSADFQQWMTNNTYRRSILPNISSKNLITYEGTKDEIPFPDNIEITNDILHAYLERYKRASHSIFVLDISESMRGDLLEKLKNALVNLIWRGEKVAKGRDYTAYKDHVTFILFNETVTVYPNIRLDEVDNSLNKITEIVSNLETRGTGTAIYDAMEQAYDIALEEQNKDPDRLFSVILLCNCNEAISEEYAIFAEHFKLIKEDIAAIRSFPVHFGDSENNNMSGLADLTGGRIHDNDKLSIDNVYKRIHGHD